MGGYHTLALSDMQTVFTWGHNLQGQLGDGTFEDRNTPFQISFGKAIVQIAAGLRHSIAVDSDGVVFTWGDNTHGQLGDGTNQNRNVPTALNMSSKVVNIAGGSQHSLAVSEDGYVFAWGYNLAGQVGDGTLIDRNTPVRVVSGALAAKIVVQVDAGELHSIALTSDGTVCTWGFNTLGGNVASEIKVPVAVDNGDSLAGRALKQIAAGGYHSLILTEDGAVFGWGHNYFGQLGDGTSLSQDVPVLVDISSDNFVTTIVGGMYHSLAMTDSGNVYSWGFNWDGELGDGTNDFRYTPILVDVLQVASKIGAGSYHSLALAISN
eukprot:c849_g1_i1.p1 GENE.c849_g1_i1~~c849_g1_i1.p1  ORF type:complete len:322 (-),score=53.10 c849_g1_i1:21-986(-)